MHRVAEMIDKAKQINSEVQNLNYLSPDLTLLLIPWLASRIFGNSCIESTYFSLNKCYVFLPIASCLALFLHLHGLDNSSAALTFFVEDTTPKCKNKLQIQPQYAKYSQK